MNLDYQLDGPEGAPVIVLSNSLGTTRAMWQPQIEALTAHFRVLRYDTHGHGKTTKNGKVTLAQLGEDVIALLDHLNIDRAWFCGISMGGLTGLWLGRFAPERFYGLAVANTAARIGDQASWLSRARVRPSRSSRRCFRALWPTSLLVYQNSGTPSTGISAVTTSHVMRTLLSMS